MNAPEPQLDSLYREVVLDHYRKPRGRKNVENPDFEQDGFNPLCGDEVKIKARVKDDKIEEVEVSGQGCSISVASGSMLADLLPGKTVKEARVLLDAFKDLMHGKEVPEDLDIGDLEALEGVNKFPVRIKCALLPWTTLDEAMKQDSKGEPADSPAT